MTTTPSSEHERHPLRHPQRRSTVIALVFVLALLLACGTLGLAGCSSDEEPEDLVTTPNTPGEGRGDIEAEIGRTVALADIRVTVKSLEATFQPSQPVQRMSEESPVAPGAGESFYQAYVRVENKGVAPVRVDPRHFACLVGDNVTSVEPTRSGPLARSLLKNTSLDLVLTFKGRVGYEPILLYSPTWYNGTIRASAGPPG